MMRALTFLATPMKRYSGPTRVAIWLAGAALAWMAVVLLLWLVL